VVLKYQKTNATAKHGFALVIALSLMAFILVLVLSMSLFVQVESASQLNRSRPATRERVS
jgi:hypothetical protein